MKSKILVGLSALGLSVAALVAVGCGDDSGEGGSGGSGGSTTSNATSTKATGVTGATVTSTVASTGSMMGDGNDTFAEADPMEENNGIPFVSENDAELNPPETDVDFYTFNGLAGLASIQGISKPDGDPYANTDPDLVIELYNAGQQLIATNDDPYPRRTQDSSLLTILPEDALYYIKVFDFCSIPNAGCGATYYDDLTDLSYGIEIYMEAAGVLANPKGEVEPNDMAGSATDANPLSTGTPGQYYLTLGYGEFSSMTDVEYFSFTMPDDITPAAGTELHSFFTFQPPGKSVGSGSGRFTGQVRIEDTIGNIIALQDWTNEKDAVDYPDLDVPLTPGASYLLRVTPGPTDADGPLAPFFIYSNGFSQSNPLETQEVTNNLAATAEVLQHPPMNTTQYFVSGHLIPADVDHFNLAVEGHTTLVVVCASARLGSGVIGMDVEVLDAGGTTLDSGTETSDAEVLLGGMTPIDVAGETNVIIKIEAGGGQNPLVSADHYRCGFGFGG